MRPGSTVRGPSRNSVAPSGHGTDAREPTARIRSPSTTTHRHEQTPRRCRRSGSSRSRTASWTVSCYCDGPPVAPPGRSPRTPPGRSPIVDAAPPGDELPRETPAVLTPRRPAATRGERRPADSLGAHRDSPASGRARCRRRLHFVGLSPAATRLMGRHLRERPLPVTRWGQTPPHDQPRAGVTRTGVWGGQKFADGHLPLAQLPVAARLPTRSPGPVDGARPGGDQRGPGDAHRR